MDTNVVVNRNTLPATAKQVELLGVYGIAPKQGLTIGEATALISAAQTARAMMAPTPAQLSRLDYLGGKRPAGAGRREISSCIAVMTALAQFRIDGDAQALANALSERFEKTVQADAPVAQPEQPVAEAKPKRTSKKSDPEEEGLF